MNSFVVDTNVAVVASGRSPQARPDCLLACVDVLEKIKRQGKIVMDDRRLILGEYMRNLSSTGKPGPGDAFFKWVLQNYAKINRCEQVEIQPRGGDGEDYEEFPNDPALDKFDPSDKKFVAVALGSKSHPIVLNAVDPDWWEHREALEDYGVRIKFLCPGHFR
ncbi:MAG: hypothetical protein KKE86_03955 [Planctomycetes bacterium]|nr:hypothetical protein [Planctomycetota bacterium]